MVQQQSNYKPNEVISTLLPAICPSETELHWPVRTTAQLCTGYCQLTTEQL